MSLYNQLFGVNPITPLLLKIVGVTLSEIPRFRDCHIDVDERGSASIVIYTRTGGGNDECNCDGNDCSGECYRAMNRELQYKKNCLDFQYDDYDSTYAYFYFNPLPEHLEIFDEILSIQEGERESVSEKFENFIENLKQSEQQ